MNGRFCNSLRLTGRPDNRPIGLAASSGLYAKRNVSTFQAGARECREIPLQRQ